MRLDDVRHIALFIAERDFEPIGPFRRCFDSWLCSASFLSQNRVVESQPESARTQRDGGKPFICHPRLHTDLQTLRFLGSFFRNRLFGRATGACF